MKTISSNSTIRIDSDEPTIIVTTKNIQKEIQRHRHRPFLMILPVIEVLVYLKNRMI